MPILSLPDTQLHYEVRGAGPPLILIAGLGSDSASWAQAAPALSNRFTLIMPDNRGSGRTLTRGPITIEAFAADILALIDHLGLKKLDLLGHSMGGAVAMVIAATAPEKVGRLVIAAAAAAPSRRTRSVIENIAEMRATGVAAPVWLRAFFHWLFRPAFFDDERAVEAATVMAMAYPYAQSAENFAAQVAALRDYDVTALVPQIEARTLCLGGELDLLIAPQHMQATLARLKNKELRLIENAAHSLHWDEPDAFAAEIIRFLT